MPMIDAGLADSRAAGRIGQIRLTEQPQRTHRARAHRQYRHPWHVELVGAAVV